MYFSICSIFLILTILINLRDTTHFLHLPTGSVFFIKMQHVEGPIGLWVCSHSQREHCPCFGLTRGTNEGNVTGRHYVSPLISLHSIQCGHIRKILLPVLLNDSFTHFTCVSLVLPPPSMNWQRRLTDSVGYASSSSSTRTFWPTAPAGRGKTNNVK